MMRVPVRKELWAGADLAIRSGLPPTLTRHESVSATEAELADSIFYDLHMEKAFVHNVQWRGNTVGWLSW